MWQFCWGGCRNWRCCDGVAVTLKVVNAVGGGTDAGEGGFVGELVSVSSVGSSLSAGPVMAVVGGVYVVDIDAVGNCAFSSSVLVLRDWQVGVVCKYVGCGRVRGCVWFRHRLRMG